jgi:hypothetical protein
VKAFYKFLKTQNILDKHNMKSAFKYNYGKDKYDFTKRAEDAEEYEDFYITGKDMIKAFEAGVAFAMGED